MPRLHELLLPLILLVTSGSWAAGPADSLHVGLFPRRPAVDAAVMFKPLADYLARRLGVPVVLHTPADYPAFWSAIEQGRYDLVHYNQYHYVRAHAHFGHRIVAMNEEFGRVDIRCNIMVRSGEPYRSLHDLRGRKILFGGDRSAMVSYILALDMLRNAGLSDDDFITQFAQNPMMALIALNYMQGDAAAAGDVGTSLSLVTQAIGSGRLQVLARSDAIPHLPWAVTSSVDARNEAAIRAALLALNDAEEGRGILASMQLTGLRPASDADYDPVRQVIARVLGEQY